MKNNKKLKYETRRERLTLVGYKNIDIAEMLDILFLIDNKKQNGFLFQTNFESTQVNYNG